MEFEFTGEIVEFVFYDECGLEVNRKYRKAWDRSLIFKQLWYAVSSFTRRKTRLETIGILSPRFRMAVPSLN